MPSPPRTVARDRGRGSAGPMARRWRGRGPARFGAWPSCRAPDRLTAARRRPPAAPLPRSRAAPCAAARASGRGLRAGRRGGPRGRWSAAHAAPGLGGRPTPAGCDRPAPARRRSAARSPAWGRTRRPGSPRPWRARPARGAWRRSAVEPARGR